ncbi:MAG: hypothetical protein NVS2B7_31570 [Herpetosiphon sp.]
MQHWIARPYEGENDLQAIAGLYRAREEVYPIRGVASAAELRQRITRSETDQASVQLWFDSAGKLGGFSLLGVRQPPVDDPPHVCIEGQFLLIVHPEAEGILELPMLHHIEQRMTLITAQAARSGHLTAWVPEVMTTRRAFLHAHGFVTVRYMYHLSRDLHGPIDEPRLPAGFDLRPVAGGADDAAWTESCNAAFADHWNHQAVALSYRQALVRTPGYRPALDLLATAPDGTIASVCIGEIRDVTGSVPEGYIATLGTRLAYRRLGLARALLQEELRRMAAAGIARAFLHVDSENPTGATRLYEAMDFTRTQTVYLYRKQYQ